MTQGPLNRPHLKGSTLVTSPHCGASFPGYFQGQEPLEDTTENNWLPLAQGRSDGHQQGLGAVSMGDGVTVVKHIRIQVGKGTWGGNGNKYCASPCGH